MKYLKLFFAFLLILGITICVYVYYFSTPHYYAIHPLASYSEGLHFVGSKECISCHLEIYNSHISSAHYNSSGKASVKNILGSFEGSKNNLYLENDVIYVKMEKKDDLCFQNTYLKQNDSLINSLRFDITIGSGTRGQTYLHWIKDSLFQIQASYSSITNNWVNSPGYVNDTIKKLRGIAPRCLECHTTYAKVNYNASNHNTYDRSKIVYGIDCERCHGPSSSHVIYHQTFPDEKEAKYILEYSSFTRKQKLDVCALCHSGIRSNSFSKSFNFMAGNNLDYFYTPAQTSSFNDIDVHGNQYGLLTTSKCFKKSETMDCSTCHDPHGNERGNLQKFIGKCLECHPSQNRVDCGLSLSESVKSKADMNCISCHMPSLPSKSMKITNGKDQLESVYLRTHHIAIYKNNNTVANSNNLERYISEL